MIVINIFGAIASTIVLAQAIRDRSLTFEILGAAFLALNLGLVIGHLS